MKHPIRHFLLGLGTVLFLAACGGGGGGGSSATTTPMPTARASASATSVEAGQTVTLDASSSTSPNGGAITYQWNVEQRPEGSAAALSAPTVANPSFTPDLPGNYLIALVVNDGRASSTAAQVALVVSNPNPVAVVIQQVSQLVNTDVQLDGSGSLAPQGGNASGLRYLWALAERPADSTAVLDDVSRAQPRFTADRVGRYVATLVVSHGTRTSTPATVTIDIGQVNAIPVANAGNAITALRGTRVTLDASASSDADNDALQYRWTLTVPQGSKATLANANTINPSFVPDFAGQYTAGLSVFDGIAQGGASVSITVTRQAGEPNNRPVAVIAAPFGKTFEVERDVPFALQGASSYDPDGTYIFGANREWTLLSAPDGFDAATNFNKPFSGFLPNEVKGTHYGNYVVQLRVFDGELWSEPVTATYTVINGANRPPIAGPGLQSKGTTVRTGAAVTLTGAGSTDPDANRLTYAWALIDKPDGSSATLLNANTVTPSFVADRTGPYVVTLVVTDEHGFSSATATLTVMAKSRNQAPVGRLESLIAYTPEQPLLIGNSGAKRTFGPSNTEVHDLWNSFSMTSNGYDPDGEALSYLWTLSQAPAGASFQIPNGALCAATGGSNWPGASVVAFDKWRDDALALRNWTCPDLSLAPTVGGLYQVQVAISDGIDFAGPYTVNVHTAERANYPNLLLEDMNRLHAWSNNDQTLVLQPYDASLGMFSGLPRQALFPFGTSNLRDNSYAHSIISLNLLPTAMGNGFNQDIVVRTMRLTAGGGDYTITGLRATHSDGVFQPRFVGLQNGQVIRRGESVEFQLLLPLQGIDIAAATRFAEGSSRNLMWSFDIQENPALTFRFSPL